MREPQPIALRHEDAGLLGLQQGGLRSSSGPNAASRISAVGRESAAAADAAASAAGESRSTPFAQQVAEAARDRQRIAEPGSRRRRASAPEISRA